MLNAAYGLDLAPAWLNAWGRQVIDIERAYNRAAGFTPEHDRLPAFFSDEAVPPRGLRWDVGDGELDGMWG